MHLLSLSEASVRLGIASSTLRNQVKAGRLAATLVGKTWVVTEDEIERYRTSNRGRAGRPSQPRPRRFVVRVNSETDEDAARALADAQGGEVVDERTISVDGEVWVAYLVAVPRFEKAPWLDAGLEPLPAIW